jgi:Ca2+-binding EF-hand superfamily protein
VSMHGDRRVLWSSFLAVGAATIAVTAAIAQKLPDPMDFGVVYEELAFEAADTDGNNLVSEGEFVRDAAAAFSGLDADRDGKLTPQELGPHDAKSFAEVDTNGDGVLTFNEVMTFKMKAFRVADTNQDDALSFDEMVGAVRAEVGK